MYIRVAVFLGTGYVIKPFKWKAYHWPARESLFKKEIYYAIKSNSALISDKVCLLLLRVINMYSCFSVYCLTSTQSLGGLKRGEQVHLDGSLQGLYLE